MASKYLLRTKTVASLNYFSWTSPGFLYTYFTDVKYLFEEKYFPIFILHLGLVRLSPCCKSDKKSSKEPLLLTRISLWWKHYQCLGCFQIIDDGVASAKWCHHMSRITTYKVNWCGYSILWSRKKRTNNESVKRNTSTSILSF